MKARYVIGNAVFGPDVLKVVFKAFDDAWEEVRPSVSMRSISLEAARLSLANIVLSMATEDSRDPDQLKTEAVRIFRLKRQISS
jgi:hypothetical protein